MAGPPGPKAEVEAGSEASERENREYEKHIAQMAEEEARLGGEEQADILFSLSWGWRIPRSFLSAASPRRLIRRGGKNSHDQILK